jgi:hypothetical protein
VTSFDEGQGSPQAPQARELNVQNHREQMQAVEKEKRLREQQREPNYKRYAASAMLMNDECDFCTPLRACALHRTEDAGGEVEVTLRRAFDSIDADGNGTLDAGEIEQALFQLGSPITCAQAEVRR